jgi:hypothetical protein
VVVVVAVFRVRGGEDVVVVDPAPAIAQAQAHGLFPVMRPQGLGSDWRSVSAVYQTSGDVGTLRIGFLTPAGGAVQLIESNEEAGSLLARELGRQVRSQGDVAVNGVAWRSSVVRGDERALVESSPTRTVIVVGSAGLNELTTLAQSLR